MKGGVVYNNKQSFVLTAYTRVLSAQLVKDGMEEINKLSFVCIAHEGWGASAHQTMFFFRKAYQGWGGRVQ